MKKKYVGILATNNIDHNGNQFSDEALRDLIEKQPLVPVRINFSGEPIGKTIGFEEKEGKVLCTFEMDLPTKLEKMNLFIVPGGRYNVTDAETAFDGSTVIKKIVLTGVSITTTPSDPTISIITPYKKEN